MIGVGIGIVGAAVTLVYWLIAASYIYCRLFHHTDLFVFPFDQWIDALDFWRANIWTRIDIVGSALIPLLPLIALMRIGYLRLGLPKSAVYGKTEWASPKQMKAGGILSRRRPF